jgi:exodeoxyribonuclease V alpha subunit
MNISMQATSVITPNNMPVEREGTVLKTLSAWSEQGFLRKLDSALAIFVQQLDPLAAPVVLVSTAMLAFVEGRGHTCIPLRTLIDKPNELLGWPDERLGELVALYAQLPNTLEDWLTALHASSVVQSMLGGAQQLGETLGTAESSTENSRPLVLGGSLQEPLLYLRRYWNYEQQVVHEVLTRTSAMVEVDEARLSEHEVRAKGVLNQLFGQSQSETDLKPEFDWQRLACALALRARLTVITGGPGTGKTYTAARLLALLFAMSDTPDRLRVSLAAPTGKAAARLRQSIDQALLGLSTELGDTLNLQALIKRVGPAKTLHSLLGMTSDSRQFRFNAMNPLDIDVLIVDEASMVHLEMMSALLQALPATASLVLLGDKDQLDSVEAGAVLGDLSSNAAAGNYSVETARYSQVVVGQVIPEVFCAESAEPSSLAQQTIMLRKSMRFGGEIGQLALAVNQGEPTQVAQLLKSDPDRSVCSYGQVDPQAVLRLAMNGRAGTQRGYATYLDLIKQRSSAKVLNDAQYQEWVQSVLLAFDQFRILCAVNKGNWGTEALNRTVLSALNQAGLISAKKEWFAGRPIMVTRNDRELGVFNGDVGVVLPSRTDSQALRAYFLDGENIRSVSVTRLAHVETAFAMTVHKSQGSEYEHVALVLPPGKNQHLSRELVYTGITRARKLLTILEGHKGVFLQAVTQPSTRGSGLGNYF